MNAQRLVDVNVNLSRWPFRRTPCDEIAPLVERLRRSNVVEAWTGSLDGLFHRDVAGVNRRLAEACAETAGLLVPFGTINPALPDWREDLRRCHEEHRMPGVRLHPNYHGYRLDEPIFGELLAAAEDRGLIVQLAARMDDDRVQHPLMRVADAELKPLADVLAKCSKLRFVLLNAGRTLSAADSTRLARETTACLEISMVEGVAGVERLIDRYPADRVLFGSHLPLFNIESALLKLRESDLSAEELAAIGEGNARRVRELRF